MEIVVGAGSLIVQFFINAAIVIYENINPEKEIQLVPHQEGRGSKVSPLDANSRSKTNSGLIGGAKQKSGVLGPKRHNRGVDDHSTNTREIENKLSGMGKLQLMNSQRRKHNEHPMNADSQK